MCTCEPDRVFVNVKTASITDILKYCLQILRINNKHSTQLKVATRSMSRSSNYVESLNSSQFLFIWAIIWNLNEILNQRQQN